MRSADGTRARIASFSILHFQFSIPHRLRCAFVHFCTNLHITQCRYCGPQKGAQHGKRNTQEIRHPARSKRIPSGGFTALPDHRACGKQRGDAQHGGYAGCSDDEGVSFSHADRDGHGKHEAACCGNRTQQQLSRTQKGAHERQQHPYERAQRALHHMRGQFSQQTGKHCCAPSPSPARRPVRPPAAAPHRNIAHRNRNTGVRTKSSKKPRICCLFIRLPPWKSHRTAYSRFYLFRTTDGLSLPR